MTYKKRGHKKNEKNQAVESVARIVRGLCQWTKICVDDDHHLNILQNLFDAKKVPIPSSYLN